MYPGCGGCPPWLQAAAQCPGGSSWPPAAVQESAADVARLSAGQWRSGCSAQTCGDRDRDSRGESVGVQNLSVFLPLLASLPVTHEVLQLGVERLSLGAMCVLDLANINRRSLASVLARGLVGGPDTDKSHGQGTEQTLTHAGAGAAGSLQTASQPQPLPRRLQPPTSQRACLLHSNPTTFIPKKSCVLTQPPDTSERPG